MAQEDRSLNYCKYPPKKKSYWNIMLQQLNEKVFASNKKQVLGVGILVMVCAIPFFVLPPEYLDQPEVQEVNIQTDTTGTWTFSPNNSKYQVKIIGFGNATLHVWEDGTIYKTREFRNWFASFPDTFMFWQHEFDVGGDHSFQFSLRNEAEGNQSYVVAYARYIPTFLPLIGLGLWIMGSGITIFAVWQYKKQENL